MSDDFDLGEPAVLVMLAGHPNTGRHHGGLSLVPGVLAQWGTLDQLQAAHDGVRHAWIKEGAGAFRETGVSAAQAVVLLAAAVRLKRQE